MRVLGAEGSGRGPRRDGGAGAVVSTGCDPEPPGLPTSTTTSSTSTTSTASTTTTTTAPPGIVSVTTDGQSSGHGRGLSAWGNYSSAVDRGWSWNQILSCYYGGTRAGTAANAPLSRSA